MVNAPRIFRTRLAALDAVAPGGGFQRGAVHELLWRPGPEGGMPRSLALILAGAAEGTIAWSDPLGELYLPAVAAAGVNPGRLMMLRCRTRGERLWALAECLRSRGVGATVALIEHLSPVEARRLQLAAERGGGIGLFMRPFMASAAAHYAAATRWLIAPQPAASEAAQRWRVELLHGHGGRVGEAVVLEVDRETRAVCAFSPLADRAEASPAAAPAAGKIPA